MWITAHNTPSRGESVQLLPELSELDISEISWINYGDILSFFPDVISPEVGKGFRLNVV
jgi:hypothetical protein